MLSSRLPPSSGSSARASQMGEVMMRLPLAERDAIALELSRCDGPDPPDAGLRAQDVRAIAPAGHEIGFHTLHHQYLPLLDDQSLRQEP